MTIETQGQRWWKYGGNVVLSSVVVILLAAGAVYIAQRNPKRLDTTLAGSNSLRPQTVAVLGEVKEKVRLVSLYPRESATAIDADFAGQDYYQSVADLLEEYARKSGSVSVDLIDPEKEPGKLDGLIKEVSSRYGQEVKPYEAFLKTSYPAFVAEFKKFADEQSRTIGALKTDTIKDPELAQTVVTAQATVTGLPDRLAEAEEKIGRRLKGNIPNYRGAVDDCAFELQILDQLLTRVTEDFKALPPAPKTPTDVAEYAAAALPAFEAAGKLVKEQLDKVKSLGDLKIDALRDSIKRRTVLVMGEKDMKVLGFADVWQAPDDLKTLMNSGTGAGSDRPRLKFAGEQQISTALVALTKPNKPRVIFVRPAGQPLTQSVMRQAQFSGLARMLREANFDVLEKDLSGQFAMQAQMQGIPVKEASDDDMRDRSAIWAVFSLVPAMSQMGPNPIPGKLKEHLDEGGSALLLVEPGRDGCETALTSFGITPRTDTVIVKEPITGPPPTGGDMVANAERIPYIFLTNRFGDHPLTKPVGALEAILLPLTPIETITTPGVTTTRLLPITRVVKTWGESDVDGVFESARPVFDVAKDIPNSDSSPLFAGVAAEKSGDSATSGGGSGGGGRLVVFGTATSFSNAILSLPDPEMERRGILTRRFPANAELFINSIYWLNRMETMLAISPAATEVNRIRPIADGPLSVIRWGILIAGLPCAVVAAGALMYLKRRD